MRERTARSTLPRAAASGVRNSWAMTARVSSFAADPLGFLELAPLSLGAGLGFAECLVETKLQVLLVLDPIRDHDFEQELVCIVRSEELLPGGTTAQNAVQRLAVQRNDVFGPKAAFHEALAE